MDYHMYQTTQNFKINDKYQNDFSGTYFDNSLQEEDSKDEESYQGNQTQGSGNGFETQTKGFDQENSLDHQISKQYQTQKVKQNYNQRKNTLENSKDKIVSVFSNSFDESAPSLELKPQRNCKSSTRMMNKTQKRQNIVPNFPVNLIHNVSTGNGTLTAGSLNRKQGAFNNFIKNKQMQSSYQQAILSQLQRANTQNSFDMKNFQDLSNRSMIQTPGGIMNNSFMINQYFGSTINQQSNKQPITPHNMSGNNQQMQQMILSAGGGQMNARQNHGVNQSNMDPYTYLRWKQQKYKSCRSIQANGGQQFQKNNQHIIANSAYLLNHKKGNQTQKNNNKSICSSNGSALGSASQTTTMTGVKSLGEVKNPSMFISWRFCDRKLTDLKDIGQFKNLAELDISGNLLQNDISELRQLQFLRKLNLSQNQIHELYPLPINLEILNISSNNIKSLSNEITMNLKNLTTLDISNNGLETLENFQNLKRLKRLISKNNLIIETNQLKDITTLVDVDLEQNPLDSLSKLLLSFISKNDLLVLNLKQSPIMLMINNYDQLLLEVQNQQNGKDELKLWIAQKMKFLNNGCLYKTKRVFMKIKTMQQHSKRSSSNFSNGSSSCGRYAANTGGRINNATTQFGNFNNSSINAFSPLLNNTVTTPNYQHTNQRFEDIEQLYDEILDEEEELERKQNKVQRKKTKKNQEDFSQDDDEDESIYEDEDYINPSMSCDEDIDDLQSYRNNANLHNEFLNESTADFNKEIKQINQELREQLGTDYLNENAIGNLDHVQSLHSSQSVSTNKKNPISFKLDLSKCTQQQSEEDDFDNTKGNNEEEEDQFDIPGLQYVKVTDDSFRQLQKQQSLQQSIRLNQEKVAQTEPSQRDTKNNTLREYPQKTNQKHVMIPKLQLGILQQNQSITQIAIKQTINQQLSLNNSKKSLQSVKTYINDEENSKRDQQKLICKPIIEECMANICSEQRKELKILQRDYQMNIMRLVNENQQLKFTIDQIKDIFCYKSDMALFPKYLIDLRASTEKERLNFNEKIGLLDLKIQELEAQINISQKNKQSQNYHEMYEESQREIQLLQEKLQQRESQYCTERQLAHDLSSFYAQNQSDLKRTQSTQQENQQNNSALQHQMIFNKPQFFYQSDVKTFNISARKEGSHDNNSSVIVDNVAQFSRKRFNCDIKKIKRPQSVAGHRKSSYCIKINSLLRVDQQNGNNQISNNIDELQYANEYGSTQDYKTPFDQPQNESGNKKVGQYIERLKERNSSLQERLNGSFGSNNKTCITKVSPINIQKVTMNMTQQQEQISNPYIISPSCDEKFQSIQTKQPGATQRVSVFKASIINQKQQKEQTVIRKISNVDSSSSINEYSSREYQSQPQNQSLNGSNGQQHSKTQRINVKKIQYNQFFLQNINTSAQNTSHVNRDLNNTAMSGIVSRGDSTQDYQINLALSGKRNSNHNNFNTSFPNANSIQSVQSINNANYGSQTQPFSKPPSVNSIQSQNVQNLN
ncbi:UNKNOWN [Stylonychia lemnae]|uniref:Leucine rich repeat family protein n=1 Tax=Stylonychia lemnae TaxID=5949 RepID=A0A077ZWP3_STYLE|nr:UNKNOWN [Stylonychia lemnae]|eukprot:CDW72911.1 UNKNOWN [Stylonychia lemnae]